MGISDLVIRVTVFSMTENKQAEIAYSLLQPSVTAIISSMKPITAMYTDADGVCDNWQTNSKTAYII